MARLRERAAAGLHSAGARYLIDTVADLFPVVETIDARLETGETPSPRTGHASQILAERNLLYSSRADNDIHR